MPHELMPTILVIDDDDRIRRALRAVLSARDYQVVLAATGNDGLDRAAEADPAVIILDLTLPDMHGIEVCRHLRQWTTAPILILSVRDQDHDKVTALDVGADDYLTKPFSSEELLARIRALLRRAGMRDVPAPLVQTGDLTIDLSHRLVTRDGQPVSLTPTEYDILAYLVQHANCVVTSGMLLEHIWGLDPTDDTQALRAHISRLRKKIEPNPAVARYLITEPGVGFRFRIS